MPRRVRINGLTYALPFEKSLPEHDADTLAGLREHIRAVGVLRPVIAYVSPTHGRAVLDGATRAVIGEEFDIDVPVLDWGEMSDDQALGLCKDLNRHRRHLTPEQRAKLRSERIGRVVAARAQGKSLRAIAEDEDVSLVQVQRDLEESPTVPGGTVASPERVTGLDGRTRTAHPAQPSRPRPTPPAEQLPAAKLNRDAQALERAAEHARALAVEVAAVLVGPHAPLLGKAAARHNAPVVGGAWPAQLAVCRALAEAAAEADEA